MKSEKEERRDDEGGRIKKRKRKGGEYYDIDSIKSNGLYAVLMYLSLIILHQVVLQQVRVVVQDSSICRVQFERLYSIPV